MNTVSHKYRQSALLLLTAAIWGSAFVAQQTGMDYVGPFTFNAARCSPAVRFGVPRFHLRLLLR